MNDFLPYDDLYVNWNHQEQEKPKQTREINKIIWEWLKAEVWRHSELTPKVNEAIDEINDYLFMLILNHTQVWTESYLIPKTQEITLKESPYFQSMMSECPKVYANLKWHQEVFTKEDLEERKEDFEINIKPMITVCAKKIAIILWD